MKYPKGSMGRGCIFTYMKSIKINQMWANILYMDPMGMTLCECQTPQITNGS